MYDNLNYNICYHFFKSLEYRIYTLRYSNGNLTVLQNIVYNDVK